MALCIILGSKIKYEPLEEDAKKIEGLVKKQRFRNPEAFIDRAIQVLLSWELEPKTSMDVMKGYTQTEEQKQILEAWLQPDIYKNNFAHNGIQSINEEQRFKEKKESKDDHLRLIENLDETKKYIKNFKITIPDSVIPYDQYPILFRFYSRLAPAKIVLSVLTDLLRQHPTMAKINLKMLRSDALDIAAEIADRITEFEDINGIKRTKKVSTGFPKLEESIEKNIPVQKRFRDQYVGKIRKDREDKKLYFEGILSALKLAVVTKESKEYFITLTEIGKEFYLLDNPILDGDYTQGLSKEEAAFLSNKIIPEIKLEKIFHETALETIKKYQYDPILQQEPIAKILDQEIIRAYNQFIEINKEDAKKFDFTPIEYEIDPKTKQRVLDKTSEKYIEGWRVATMGRLTELKQVEWEIDTDGKSVFTLTKNR